MKTMMMVFKKHFGGMGEYERYRHEYSNVNIFSGFTRICLSDRTSLENQHFILSTGLILVGATQTPINSV